MSVSYTGVGWTPHKKVYDAVIAGAVALYLGAFIGVSLVALPAAERPDAMSLAIRALGTCAILMLHLVLWIGPLARFDRRFLPLLFNRRHLGVATFLVGLGHAALALLKHHAFGEVSPLVSLLTANTAYGSLGAFPFETLGLLALVVLFLMAATSHDFWLRNLSARVWKWLHMLVYAAYALLVMHVALGALQSEPSPVYAAMLLGGVAATLALHVAAGRREAARDRGTPPERGLLDAGLVDDIPANRARVVCAPGGERIAVFRYDGKVSAVTNVCAHQGGPLGEGKVVDGCITCPWHGWQYKPGDGCSPPPFAEKIATYRVTLEGRRILVDPRALPPGTAVEPAVIPEGPGDPADPTRDEFYVGYLPAMPARHAARARQAVVLLAILFAGIAALAATLQAPAGDGVWETEPITATGFFSAEPYPILYTLPLSGSSRATILVGAGKCGALEPEAVCGSWALRPMDDTEREAARRAAAQRFEGRLVEVRGRLLRRAGREMIELAPGPEALRLAPREPGGMDIGVDPSIRSLGPRTLRGEIVDPKCFLGAMKPGRGKVHRACAIRCISGGIPPMLAARDESGGILWCLLADARGGPVNEAVLPFVGDAVEAAGMLEQRGDLHVLRVDPGTLRRDR